MAYIPRGPGVNFIQGLMKDTCLITRQSENNRDDILDLETGELVDPLSTITIYSGKCTLQPMSQKDRDLYLGMYPEFRKVYRVLLPHTVTNIELGDTFTITSSPYNEHLLNLDLRVMSLVPGTQRVYYRIHVEDIRDDHNPTIL